jgi:hypothetical protein
MSQETADNLRAALQYMREHGWYQGGLFPEAHTESRADPSPLIGAALAGSPACAIGACGAAKVLRGVVVDRWEYGSPEVKALCRALENSRGLSDFNDDPYTTFADIEALFERAIVAEEAKA